MLPMRYCWRLPTWLPMRRRGGWETLASGRRLSCRCTAEMSPPTDAESPVLGAAAQLLRRPKALLPPWMSTALEYLIALVAGSAKMQATYPDRVTLKKHFAALAAAM